MPTRRRVDTTHRREAIDEVFAHWRSLMQSSRSRLDEPREQAIARALGCGYSVEDLKLAIEGCRASPWHQGRNDRQRVFNDIELICRDAKHVDQFMAIAEEARRREEARRSRERPANAENVVPFEHKGEEARERAWGLLRKNPSR